MILSVRKGLVVGLVLLSAAIAGPGSLQVSSADGPKLALGTAFFIGRDGAMLTNRHVVTDCRRVLVIPEDGKPYQASILAISPDYDLAALMVHEYAPKSILPVRAAADGRHVSIPEDGEGVVTGGFSHPIEMKLQISIVDGVTLGSEGYSDSGSITSIKLSSVQRGASGSPVVDYSGNLVGVVYAGVEQLSKPLTGGFEKFDSVVYFHNNNAIADFLTKERIQFHFRPSTRQLSRLEVVGSVFTVTALVSCEQ